MKKIICLLCAALMFMGIQPVFAEYTKVSDWAKPEVDEAVNIQFIKPYIEIDDLTQNVTRNQFAEMLVSFIEFQAEYSLSDMIAMRFQTAESQTSPFYDAPRYNSPIVQACTAKVMDMKFDYTQNGLYKPDDYITRKDAVKALYKAYLLYSKDYETKVKYAQLVTETDNESYKSPYSDWKDLEYDFYYGETQEAAAALTDWKVIQGNANGELRPNENITFEQVYIMLLRLYKNAPQSRLHKNVTGIITFEERVLEVLNSIYWRTVYMQETKDCMIIYGYQAGTPHGNMYRFKILYKNGGTKLLNEQFKYDYSSFKDFELDNEEKYLYFTETGRLQNNPENPLKRYKVRVDLENGIAEYLDNGTELE